jgi:hypothetical protein
VLDSVYRAVAWQYVHQIRHNTKSTRQAAQHTTGENTTLTSNTREHRGVDLIFINNLSKEGKQQFPRSIILKSHWSKHVVKKRFKVNVL